jgi:predicted nucleic acid-binding protein
MNVYVESNFVLELALLQEEHESCERILMLCESGRAQLIIPAYSLTEPNETLIRRDRDRKRLSSELRLEFGQLSRSKPNQLSIDTFQSVLNLLSSSGEQQKQRFADIRNRLLQVALVVPLDTSILSLAAAYEGQFSLSPQDSLVFASVLQRLDTTPSLSCFLTRNSADFDTTRIREALGQRNCKLLFNFTDGYNYIQNQI